MTIFTIDTVDLYNSEGSLQYIVNKADYDNYKDEHLEQGLYVKGHIPKNTGTDSVSPTLVESNKEDAAFISYAEAKALSFTELRQYADQFDVQHRSKEGLLEELVSGHFLA